MNTTILAPRALIGNATNNKQDMFDMSIFEVIDGKVNLTKMAKHFGKEVKEWTRLEQSKNFIVALSSIYPDEQFLSIKKGGSGEQGTFGTREVALKLAQWISPEFEVFCIQKLDELFQTGKTQLTTTKELTRLEILTLALETEKENIRLKEQNTRLLHAKKTYTTTELSKELGFKSAIQLNKILEANKIQYKCNQTWVLYSKYSDKGYTDIKQTELDNGKIVYDRLWTGLGRDFLLTFNFNQLCLAN